MTLVRRLLLALAVSGFFAASSALAETTTRTSCYGGESDGAVLRLTLPGVPGVTEETTMYLSRVDGMLWWEDNGVAGLQRTAKICYEQTYDENGVIVSARIYQEYDRDHLLAP